MIETPVRADPRRWWMLAVLCLSLLIVFVGNSSLNVTIPTLSRDLHATESELQWVVASYSLVFAGLLFSAGAIGDRFGRKGALQLGLVGFLFGAALASASTAMWELIACRALMGGAAAGPIFLGSATAQGALRPGAKVAPRPAPGASSSPPRSPPSSPPSGARP